jgi:cysteine synthase
VETSSGQAFDYSEATLAFAANWIPNKVGIFARLAEYPNLKFVVFRSAAEESLSFIINDAVHICDICDHGLDLVHKTEKRESISLVSLVLRQNKDASSCEHIVPYAHVKPPRIVHEMTELIGNTPMLRLNPEKTGLKNIYLYAKLEHLNPFGSIKDRTAWGMLRPHIHNMKEKNKSVLELSSGNAARGLQAIASLHGLKLETISNRIRVSEMREMLHFQGAKITPMPENVDSSDAMAALEAVDKRAEQEKEDFFYTDQYRNPNNDGTHYSGTGKEIIADLGSVDYFIGSVGTAGSSIGISRRLKEANNKLDITGVISEKEDYVPGIRHKDEIFNIGPFKENHYARLIDIDVQTAIDGILELTRNFGVMAGPSSGATYMAAIRFLKQEDKNLKQKKTAVFVVCDRVEMYLSWIKQRRPELFM